MKNLSLAEIENYLVRHPRSNGITSQTITKIMEALYLNVKTVPAIDPEHHLPHTAYTVFTTDGDGLRFASGWTLRDAIHLPDYMGMILPDSGLSAPSDHNRHPETYLVSRTEPPISFSHPGNQEIGRAHV